MTPTDTQETTQNVRELENWLGRIEERIAAALIHESQRISDHQLAVIAKQTTPALITEVRRLVEENERLSHQLDAYIARAVGESND